MKKEFLSLILISLVSFQCTSTKKAEDQNDNREEIVLDEVENINDDQVVAIPDSPESIYVDDKGNELSVVYEGELATIFFEGNDLSLKQQEVASGFSYSDDVYELRGKGDEVILHRNGEVVFQSVKLK